MADTGARKSVTVRDLAKICGVSPATVSRVLSGSDYPVNRNIREEILKTAQEMNYSSRLESRVTREIEVAILVPTTANPFYSSMIEGFEAAIVHDNLGVLVYNTSTGFPKEGYERILRSLLSKKLKGIVISASNNNPMLTTGAQELTQQGVKVVLADCPKPDYRYNCISYNYEKGSFIGTQYLIDNGHTNIVYAGLEVERESRRLRILGFQRALEANRLPVREEDIFLHQASNCEDASQLEYGEWLSHKIIALNQRPTAVMAINDLVALGLLRGFQKNGVRVPKDISIMGFDDSPYSELTSPPLTTICVQARQMGHMAAMLLLADIKGTSSQNVNLSLEPYIVERSTVLKLN